MNPSLCRTLSRCITGALILSGAQYARASVPSSPELETLRIAKLLKPIPDDEWKKIAGDHVTQKYQVVKGDTLYDISKRLFGDAKYWPKIWALNNKGITNPHLIYPGRKIIFLPGTGTSLPSITVAENDETSESDSGQHRSEEWKLLPKQSWEDVNISLPPQVDALGFDERSQIIQRKPTSFDLPLMVSSQKLQRFGLIFGAEKESNIISMEDLVFIHPESDLQIGQTYSITKSPETLDTKYTDRTGYSYELLGHVKILQQRDGAYVGLITNAKGEIERGSILIPLEPRVPEMTPIPGPSAIEGSVLVDHRDSTSTTAQHKFVFIDRGSDDGVSPGMVFRTYDRIDRNNGKEMTSSNALINADILVLQVSARFCMGLVVTSYNSVTEGTKAVLLTDVSDFLKRHPGGFPLETTGMTPPDELDSLDNGLGLSDKEKRELKQLEKWKQNGASPSPAPTPSEEAVPAPSEEPVPAPSPAESVAPEEVPPPTAPTPEAAPSEVPTPDQAAPPEEAPPEETAPPAPSDETLPPPPDSGTTDVPPAPGESQGEDIPPPPPSN